MNSAGSGSASGSSSWDSTSEHAHSFCVAVKMPLTATVLNAAPVVRKSVKRLASSPRVASASVSLGLRRGV